MNYQKINKFDTANGPGIRVSLFVSGCSFGCRGCFNNGAWSYSSGSVFDDSAFRMLLNALDNDFCSGLSILGGEPLEPRNIGQVAVIVETVRRRFPKKSIWLWTGYEMSELTARVHKGDIYTETVLCDVDVIVDGQYNRDLPTKKPYRGSDNQIMWVKTGNNPMEFKEHVDNQMSSMPK